MRPFIGSGLHIVWLTNSAIGEPERPCGRYPGLSGMDLGAEGLESKIFRCFVLWEDDTCSRRQSRHGSAVQSAQGDTRWPSPPLLVVRVLMVVVVVKGYLHMCEQPAYRKNRHKSQRRRWGCGGGPTGRVMHTPFLTRQAGLYYFSIAGHTGNVSDTHTSFLRASLGAGYDVCIAGYMGGGGALVSK